MWDILNYNVLRGDCRVAGREMLLMDMSLYHGFKLVEFLVQQLSE